MTLPAGYASRPATWDDLDAVVERFNVGDRADVGFEEPIRGHLEEEWRTPTFDLASSTLMAFKDHWRYEPCPSISTSSRWVGWIPEGKEVVGVALGRMMEESGWVTSWPSGAPGEAEHRERPPALQLRGVRPARGRIGPVERRFGEFDGSDASLREGGNARAPELPPIREASSGRRCALT